MTHSEIREKEMRQKMKKDFEERTLMLLARPWEAFFYLDNIADIPKDLLQVWLDRYQALKKDHEKGEV